ncbi:hypothetical protein DFH28DRAFT_910520 [Melampsora americana]|nr:hypothetical protein DFH28DRAFT_910520 [Melampsora americana]
MDHEHDELEFNGALTPTFFENISNQPELNLETFRNLLEDNDVVPKGEIHSDPEVESNSDYNSDHDDKVFDTLLLSFNQIDATPNFPANPIPSLQARRNTKRNARNKAKAEAAQLTISDRACARRLNDVLKKAPHPRECQRTTNPASGVPESFISDPILNHQRGIFKKITFSQDDWKLVRALNDELKVKHHLVQIPLSSKSQLTCSQLTSIHKNNSFSLKQLSKYQWLISPDTVRILMMRSSI